MTQLLTMSMLAGAIIAGATIMLTRDLQRAVERRRIRENYYKGPTFKLNADKLTAEFAAFADAMQRAGKAAASTATDLRSLTAGRDVTYWRNTAYPNLADPEAPCRTCRILSRLGLDNHVRHHHPKHRGRA